MPILHCIVRGRVQGVGFRYFVQRSATSLRLSGWVRNLRDGDVETEVEGPRDSLEQFLGELRRGPALARVLEVAERWEEAEGRHSGFHIHPTGY